MTTIDGRKHQPLLLPETLADELLKMGTICLGLRECPVKVFISVTRCHKCLLYDHLWLTAMAHRDAPSVRVPIATPIAEAKVTPGAVTHALCITKRIRTG